MLSDKRLLGYDGTRADGGIFADHGLHSNQRAIVDGGIMNHRKVPDNNLIADCGMFGSVDDDALFDQ